MSKNFYRETSSESQKEMGSNTIIALTHKGASDPKLNKWLNDFRKGAQIEYISGSHLPHTPPGGATEVFMDSGSDPLFRSAEHQMNWGAVNFIQLAHSHDGRDITISQEPRKRARDFEVRES